MDDLSIYMNDLSIYMDESSHFQKWDDFVKSTTFKKWLDNQGPFFYCEQENEVSVCLILCQKIYL